MKKTFTIIAALVAGALQAETVLTFSPSGASNQKTDCLPTDISSPNAPFTWETWFYVASGKLNLAGIEVSPSTNSWNVSGATYKVKGKAMLDDGWLDVDPAAVDPALRFFAVELVLP